MTAPANAPARRALPGRIVDLVRDGVPATDLPAGGDRAVFRALVSVAASHQQHGQTFSDFATLLGQARSELGRQARIRRGREVVATKVDKALLDAWRAAERWLAKAPPPMTQKDARRRATEVLAATEDADADLDDAERAVLHHAATVALRNGTDRPTLPRRAVAEATGLGERAVRSALDRLCRRSLLTCESRGRPGNPANPDARARAALYRLPTAEALDAYLYRGTRSVGPPGQVYGTPADGTHGTPARSMGPPNPYTTEDPMPSVTITAATPEVLAAVVQALAGNRDVSVISSPRRPDLRLVGGEAP